MATEIHPYDRETIEYLRAVGVGEPLLDRVRRLAEEVAESSAGDGFTHKQAVYGVSKAGL